MISSDPRDDGYFEGDVSKANSTTWRADFPGTRSPIDHVNTPSVLPADSKAAAQDDRGATMLPAPAMRIAAQPTRHVLGEG